MASVTAADAETLEALAGAQIVDGSFLRMLHSCTTVHVVGPDDLASAGNRLAAGAIPGQALGRRAPTLEAAS